MTKLNCVDNDDQMNCVDSNDQINCVDSDDQIVYDSAIFNCNDTKILALLLK